MSLDKASNMVFVSRASNAFAAPQPQRFDASLEAPTGPPRPGQNAPSTTKPTVSQDIKAAEVRQADTQARVQQQAQRVQLPNLRPADTPNLFAAAFVQGGGVKNPLSNNAYRGNNRTTAREKLPMGTNFAGMMDEMTSAGQGPSDAINRMSTRMNFFDDPTTQASLS